MASKPSKLQSRKSLAKTVAALKKQGKKVVFTNGCFDLLHIGHVRLFKKAKTFGDKLIVAINSDSSLKKLKGSGRPLVNEKSRAELLASLEVVDYVVVFSQDTPAEVIKELKPNVLVKGGDYKLNQIVGRNDVDKVVIFPVVKGFSTTALIKKVVSAYGK